MQTVSYRGWPNCIRLANDQIELIATTDIGPRIIHLGKPGGENLFGVMPDTEGVTGGDEWRLYGGHRLWHSPEAKPRSYFPDNGPVEAFLDGDTLRLVPPPEPINGIQKEISLTLIGDEAHVEVHHVLENIGPWPLELAPWALSVMNLNGVAVIPQPQWSTEGNLLPNRTLTLWPYTKMTDPRVTWGDRYILLRQDPKREATFKVGISASDGWAAYARNGQLFIKTFAYEPDAVYPDGGCSVESYVCDRFLELETVGPLTLLEPGEVIEHVEHWFLYGGVGEVKTEQDADHIVRPLANEAVEASEF